MQNESVDVRENEALHIKINFFIENQTNIQTNEEKLLNKYYIREKCLDTEIQLQPDTFDTKTCSVLMTHKPITSTATLFRFPVFLTFAKITSYRLFEDLYFRSIFMLFHRNNR